MKCHEKIESNIRFNYENTWDPIEENMLEEVIVEELFQFAAE